MPKEDQAERELAWTGDAVLSLWAREWILRHLGTLDGDVLEIVCSNHFLSRFGRPTAVEARLGAVYREGGLEAAAAWLEEQVAPAMLREIRKRRPELGGRLPKGG